MLFDNAFLVVQFYFPSFNKLKGKEKNWFCLETVLPKVGAKFCRTKCCAIDFCVRLWMTYIVKGNVSRAFQPVYLTLPVLASNMRICGFCAKYFHEIENLLSEVYQGT